MPFALPLVTRPRRRRADSLDFTAWALHRALTDGVSRLTLQEGLYYAYTRNLRWLGDVDGIPADLQGAIEELLGKFRDGFGLDLGGHKISPSRLAEGDSATLWAELCALSRAVDKAAGLRSLRD